MVSVNDAMEHSNVSGLVQILFFILLLSLTHFYCSRLEVLVKSMTGNDKKKKKKKIAILWRRPEYSNFIKFEVKPDIWHPLVQSYPLGLLVANTHSHKTTAMTNRQFSGLLSILNGSLALFFSWFFCVQCKPFAVMSAKGCAPIKTTCIYKVENGQSIIFINPQVFVSQDLKVIGWPGSGASNHSYHTTLRPRISISHVVQLLQRK